MKLLIDECLSTELTKRAQERGHDLASHVTWIGKRGWKDWQLKKVILDGDWTFVTNDASLATSINNYESVRPVIGVYGRCWSNVRSIC